MVAGCPSVGPRADTQAPPQVAAPPEDKAAADVVAPVTARKVASSPPASREPPSSKTPIPSSTSREPEAKAPPKRTIGSKSKPLPNGLFNPMPGGVLAGYRADTGLDIAGNRMRVYAIAAGTLDYSEPGHTLWTGPGDTANTVRLALDEPIDWGERKITHVWYAHLSELVFHQKEGAKDRIHVEAGEWLGVSGVANGSPHLHLGLLLDGEVEQHSGTYLLEDEVRVVLGGLRHGHRLPAE